MKWSLCGLFKKNIPIVVLLLPIYLLNAQAPDSFIKTSPRPALYKDTARSYLLLAKWFQEAPQYNRDSVNGYFTKATHLLEKKEPKNYTAITEAYLQQAQYNYYFHFFRDADRYSKLAEESLKKVLNINESTDKLKYEVYYIRAITLLASGQNKNGLKYYTKAYNILQDNNDPLVKAKVLKDKGFFNLRYSVWDELSIAEKDFRESESIYRAAGIPETDERYRIIYSGLVNCYMPKQHQENLTIYRKKLLLVTQHMNNPYTAAYPYMSNGEIFTAEKNYDSAIYNIHISMKLLEKYGMERTNYYQYNLYLLGLIAKEQKEYEKAINYFLQSKEIATELYYTETILENLSNLAEAYFLKKDYKNAFLSQKEFTTQNTKLITERSEQSMKEQDLQYGLLEKQTELQKSRNNRNLLVAWLIGIIIIAIFIYNSLQNQKKISKLLQLQNAEKDILLKEIHHRVKNNLTIISSLLELQSDNTTDETSKATLLQGTIRVRSIALIHQRLYQLEDFSAIELNGFVNDLYKQIASVLKDDRQEVVVENNIPGGMQLDIDTAVPLAMILNELITNSFKHAFKHTKQGILQISLEKMSETEFQLIYRDNGPGLPNDLRIEHSKSLGLRLIHRLALQLGGKAIVSKIEKGAQFMVQFKYECKKKLNKT